MANDNDVGCQRPTSTTTFSDHFHFKRQKQQKKGKKQNATILAQAIAAFNFNQ